jgi:hypothetical protein
VLGSNEDNHGGIETADESEYSVSGSRETVSRASPGMKMVKYGLVAGGVLLIAFSLGIIG